MPPLPSEYNDYGTWLRLRFGHKVQKLSIDAGFSCPNRDGTISHGGCIYCDNRTFNPSYCQTGQNVRSQLEAGKIFFRRKYPDMKYLAYFQAYTNTYADLDTLRRLYEEALSVEDVEGIVIGTRPDCMPDPLLDYLERLNRQTFLTVEYGIESTSDHTLQFIRRGHDFACCRDTIERTAQRGILTGGHVIIGLPGESPENLAGQAAVLSALPLDILKIHQLQIIKGTPLARLYSEKPFPLFTVEEYVAAVADYIRHLRPSMILERFVSQSPKELLVAPKWGMKNHEFTNLFVNYLRKNHIRQGDRYPVPADSLRKA